MKITNSIDQVKRAEIKISFRLNLSEIVNAIIYNVLREYDFENKPNKAIAIEDALKYYTSRAKILKTIQDAYWREGINLWALLNG